ECAVSSRQTIKPRPARVVGERIDDSTRSMHATAPDTLETVARTPGRLKTDRLPRIREAARRVVRLICLTPERLPALDLSDVTLGTDADADDEAETVHLDRLVLEPGKAVVHFEARGQTRLERDTP